MCKLISLFCINILLHGTCHVTNPNFVLSIKSSLLAVSIFCRLIWKSQTSFTLSFSKTVPCSIVLYTVQCQLQSTCVLSPSDCALCCVLLSNHNYFLVDSETGLCKSYLLFYYYCVYLGLVGSAGTFPREQVAPSNLRSLGLALQFLQFQAMLLFAKALYSFLHLTSSTSLSIFSISPLGLQLQLEQPQL